MKVLHIVSRFYPDQGGSEKFIGGLIRGLQTLGVSGCVVCFGESPAVSVWRGVPVCRLRWSSLHGDEVEEYMAFGDKQIAAEIGAVVETEAPDLVHLHTRTREVAAELVREISRRRLPTVFTYHHPAATCLRGDLRRWSRAGCDGELDARRCTACQLHHRGVPRLAAVAVASVPRASAMAAVWCGGRFASALRIGSRTRVLHDQMRSFLRGVSHCVTLCSWSRDLLVRNGVPRERVTVIRPGIVTEESVLAEGAEPESPQPGMVNLVYVGRIAKIKGVHVAVEALRKSTLKMTLTIHGVTLDSEDRAYLQALRQSAGEDPRIRFGGPLAADRVVSALRRYDGIVVPSLFPETGPMVVYEAFSAGIPVIGSDVGAINEVVKDRVSGRLLPLGGVNGWRQGLTEIAREPQELQRMRANAPAPRAMSDVAADTVRVYQRARSSGPAEVEESDAMRP